MENQEGGRGRGKNRRKGNRRGRGGAAQVHEDDGVSDHTNSPPPEDEEVPVDAPVKQEEKKETPVKEEKKTETPVKEEKKPETPAKKEEEKSPSAPSPAPIPPAGSIVNKMNDVVSTVKDEVVQDVAALNAYAMEHSPPITDAISSTIDTVSEKISNHVITPIFNPDEKEEGTGKETGCLEANCQKCSVM